MGLFGKKDREKAGQFIFLTEQIFSMGQIGIAAVGTVSGKVHVGDAVYPVSYTHLTLPTIA